MRSILTVSLVLAGGLLGGALRDASAAVITIDAANRGVIQLDGGTGGTGAADSSYLTGNFTDHGDGELRSWFQFTIPALPGPIASARLILDTAEVTVDQGPSMTLSVTSLPSVFGFPDLGTGTIYGSRVYSVVDASTTQFISLSAAALADISASELGTFGTSERISAGASFGPSEPNQFLFGFSHKGASTQLEITIVPEPSAITLTALALLGLLAHSHRRRRA